MESQRTFLFIGLLLVTYLLFIEWNNDYGPQPAATQASAQVNTTDATAADTDVPASDLPSNAAPTVAKARVIQVTTDVLDVKINTQGGDIIEANLLQYEEELGNNTPFMLLGEFGGNEYFAQSGLVGANGPDAHSEGRPTYQVEQQSYTLTGDTLVVPMTFTNDQGIEVVKTYTFKKGQYDAEVSFTVKNSAAQAASVQMYNQIRRTVQEKGSMVDQTYLGTAYGTEEEPYEKYSFSDIADKDLKEMTLGGYVAFIQHYFVSAWVPKQDQTNAIYSMMRGGNTAVIGVKSQPITVPTNGEVTLSSTYYMGPKNQDALSELHPDLDLTVDYGWLWFISQPLFSLLKLLYGFIGNWGFAIIAITVIVKMILYPLTKAQYTSMAKMRALQPKMQALKDKYGDDRQKFGQAMMEMYRKEKVNPMGGCFPLLLQMPIFLALFYVFLESTELRHAEFGLWLTDLSAKDPYFILPILFGASMFLTQKLQPTTITDPMQQKMMTWMPVIFSVFFIWFPSGLVLYWLVSNLISIAQMLYIYRGMEKKGIKAK